MLRLKLLGEVDLSVSGALLVEFLAAAEGDTGASIAVDCSGLEFIDSSGLRLLDDLQNATGKRVVLVDVPKVCRRVFEISGMDQVLELRSNGQV